MARLSGDSEATGGQRRCARAYAGWTTTDSVAVIAVILLNAITLRLQTVPSVVRAWGGVLQVLDRVAVALFGTVAPPYFGDLGASLFSLFQIMTTEGWADIARETTGVQPLAWIFFVTYILASTLTVLNLFIAVVVNAMEQQVASEVKVDVAEHQREDAVASAEILRELRSLRAEVAAMRR